MCDRCGKEVEIAAAMSCIYGGREKRICRECLALYPENYCCCCINPPYKDEVKKD